MILTILIRIILLPLLLYIPANLNADDNINQNTKSGVEQNQAALANSALKSSDSSDKENIKVIIRGQKANQVVFVPTGANKDNLSLPQNNTAKEQDVASTISNNKDNNGSTKPVESLNTTHEQLQSNNLSKTTINTNTEDEASKSDALINHSLAPSISLPSSTVNSTQAVEQAAVSANAKNSIKQITIPTNQDSKASNISLPNTTVSKGSDAVSQSPASLAKSTTETTSNEHVNQGIPISSNSYVTIPHSEVNKATGATANFNITKKVNINEINTQKCADVPLNFYNCSLSLCYESAPFGKIYRKILGEEKGECKYIERVVDLGGMDCSFPLTELENISDLLKKHYLNLYDTKAILTDNEIISLREIYQKYCKVLPTSTFTKVVTIGENKFNKDELSEIIKFTPTLPVSAKPVVAKEATQISGYNSLGINSIMFKPEQITNIWSAVEEFINLDKIKDQITQITASDQARRELTTFYLNSIIYLSELNWSIWLNNFRLSGSPADGINIEAVTDSSVEFTWKSKNFDLIYPGWESNLIRADGYYKSRDERIKVYSNGNHAVTIHFILKPNQTFIADTLSIVEGKVKNLNKVVKDNNEVKPEAN